MTSSPISSAVQAEQERVDRICPTHGPFKALVVKVADCQPIIGRCQLCVAELAAKKEAEELEAKAKDRKRKVDALIEQSDTPQRFMSATLEGYAADSVAQRKVLNHCRQFVEHYPEAMVSGASLVLCGRPGTGKTHLACAMGKGIAELWLRPFGFSTALQAIRSIKETYRKDSDRTESDAIDRLTEIDLLILDEVGVQLGTEHEKMLMFEVINERYQRCRPTILISNLNRAELTEYLGERIMDRFAECGAVLAFDWSSHRRKQP